MRPVLLLAALLAYSYGLTQPHRFVHHNYQPFFKWFHQQSQVDQLYRNHSTLYIFGHEARAYAAPSRSATVVAQLNMGQPVANIAYGEYDPLPTDKINGYNDLWYHVRGKDRNGQAFEGYVWGADIARGWRQADITGDGQAEFILLGLSAQPRTAPGDIKAELRVLQGGRLMEQRLIPGLCLFEECGASPMLRVLQDAAQPRLTVIEASTMTIGCSVGIEKAFYFWNGRQLERIFHAEFTTQHIFAQKEFSFAAETNAAGQITALSICHYRQEDQHYNPVWECRTVPVAAEKPQGKEEEEKVEVKARAR